MTELIVKWGKLWNDIKLIQFENENEKNICLTIILSFVWRINDFNRRIIDNVCNINNILKYYKLNI